MAENNFFIDSDKLNEKALERKHRLENDPSSRTNHMEYMEGMERIDSDIMDKVLTAMNVYDYDKYTDAGCATRTVHESCDIEEFQGTAFSGCKATFRGDGKKTEDRDQQTFRKYRLYLHAALHSQLL